MSLNNYCLIKETDPDIFEVHDLDLESLPSQYSLVGNAYSLREAINIADQCDKEYGIEFELL